MVRLSVSRVSESKRTQCGRRGAAGGTVGPGQGSGPESGGARETGGGIQQQLSPCLSPPFPIHPGGTEIWRTDGRRRKGVKGEWEVKGVRHFLCWEQLVCINLLNYVGE